MLNHSRIVIVNLLAIIFIIARSESVCNENDFRLGQWIAGAENCGLLDTYRSKVQWSDHQRIQQEFYENKVGRDTELPKPFHWSKWCWKPKGCTPKKFSKEEFCKVVNKKLILFVGDSLLFQMYTALYFQLETTVGIMGQRDMTGGKGIETNGMGSICDNHAKSFFIRNDHLTTDGEGGESIEGTWHSNWFSNVEWKSALPHVDYLIINKGHHSVAHSAETEAILDKANKKLATYLRDNINATKTQVIFVTTSVPHPYCAKDSKPVLDALETEDQLEALMHAHVTSIPKAIVEKAWGWESFYRHDKSIVATMRSIMGPDRITVLDIAPMTLLRPDGHRYPEPSDDVLKNSTIPGLVADCLHYWLPSVVDNWVFGLFNVMRHKQR